MNAECDHIFYQHVYTEVDSVYKKLYGFRLMTFASNLTRHLLNSVTFQNMGLFVLEIVTIKFLWVIGLVIIWAGISDQFEKKHHLKQYT